MGVDKNQPIIQGEEAKEILADTRLDHDKQRAMNLYIVWPSAQSSNKVHSYGFPKGGVCTESFQTSPVGISSCETQKSGFE